MKYNAWSDDYQVRLFVPDLGVLVVLNRSVPTGDVNVGVEVQEGFSETVLLYLDGDPVSAEVERMKPVYEAAREWERLYDALENPESDQDDAENCYQANLKLQGAVREAKKK